MLSSVAGTVSRVIRRFPVCGGKFSRWLCDRHVVGRRTIEKIAPQTIFPCDQMDKVLNDEGLGELNRMELPMCLKGKLLIVLSSFGL
jgi:hypothetical protein